MVIAARCIAVFSVVSILANAPAAGASSRDPSPPADAAPSEIVYPPASEGLAPVTVFLHGMCDTPENECAYFARTVTRRGWLVCPRAPSTCGNGGSRWSGGHDGDFVEAAVQRLQLRYPGRVVDENRTIIGFSQGAFVAADILQQRGQQYRYSLLIAGKVPLETSRLAKGGVVRLLLSAGDRDGASIFMQTAAQRLGRGGLDARFTSLGNVGHSFAENMDTWLDGALGWLWAPQHTV